MARFELKWDPFEQGDPGPCIDVVVMNSRDVIEAGTGVGSMPAPLVFPGPTSGHSTLFVSFLPFSQKNDTTHV